MKKHDMRDLFYVVNVVYENYGKHGKEVQELWAERIHDNFQNGDYEVAYKYVAMQELLLFKFMPKNDTFRLKVWRMFIANSRRAFSNYEYAIFLRLKEVNAI